ncbi:sensor histidine kinase [Cellulomonas fimi]|uniref:histidine kinase n=1 Tax=Cellulomonas fimi (strain ATCC 484 / DSM 20113 / JCM 1341 / CCUG 24087 / LMG 16345 / NBRC 15513 / NCIMB 8980 / NCTC 7547 / NRS-133) TaxID=590998 RepID=F4H7P5_CELFA|nr:ATP-binding protein [Cellulomonas fimi]AEE45729.1 integral membrane sensor signal transduction histidine kinase [Cellulomonas fimi ATCC 484]VEH30421.1 Phytochrome-like protein cph1 [Cellulomonas fimi]
MTATPSRAARRRATLRSRLLGLLLTAAFALALVVAGTGLVLGRVLERQDAVTETFFDAVTQADGAYIQLVDSETSVRGFALTGDEVTLEPFERAAEDDLSFRTLAEREAERGLDPELTAAAQAAGEAGRRWHEEFAQPVMEQVRAGGTAAVTSQEIESGRVLFDDARGKAETYMTLLRDRRSDAVDELSTWTLVAAGTVVLLVLAAIAVGISLWVALRRWVLEPLRDLAADARAVASGDLTHPVEATGPGEIAALADDVERMRVALVTEVRAVEASRAEIADAHEQLTTQAEELRRSNRDLEQFAYVASHDLQEPLRKIASFTQLLQKRYGGQLDERADQYIAFAVDGAKRMQRLINDLLGFSRVGRMGGEVTDVDLDAALAEAVDNLGERIAETGAVVTHDPLPTVQGEEALLVQLFQNVVGNAVKFRHPDRTPQVHLSARRVGEEWEIECRDNGIGIDQQYADRVFVIFQRLHAKDVYEGTGIGLALCKKIVEFHNGRIWIEPSPETGTRILWTLPVPAADTVDATP